MNNIVIVVALIWLLISAIIGYAQGFVKTIYSILSIIVAIGVVLVFREKLRLIATPASCLITFAVVMGILGCIGKILDIIDYLPIIKGVNRWLGIIAGLVKGSVVFWFIIKILKII
ncbi:MAG: CvpA family protein [bacterium]|nr:CvpA family protein [bacterium]